MAYRTPSEDRESHARQSPESPTGTPQQTSQKMDLPIQLTCEDGHLSPSKNLPGVVEEVINTPAVTLHKSSYILYIVVIYASLALTAWILICILTFRPLTTARYGYNALESRPDKLPANYDKSEAIHRAARIVQSIVTVLAIPLTSAVCSAAAVIFAQSKTKGRRLTMRQTMALADEGWTDPTTIASLVTGCGKKLSSPFLTFALLLVVLGASITPLQTLFMSQTMIRVPHQRPELLATASRVFDISSFFKQYPYASEPGSVAALTQDFLISAYTITPQPHLWQEGIECSPSIKGQTEACISEPSAFGNFTALSNPYLAPLLVGYHTGVIKQFAPRINSTVQWEIVSPDDVPVDCIGSPDSFHALYTKPSETDQDAQKSWSIEVCMPGTQSVSPWKNTNCRQEFTEELFMNISVTGYDSYYLDSAVYQPREGDDTLTGGTFRVTSTTTAGYFELPNYMNGGQAGPIIDGEPDDSENCGIDCRSQDPDPYSTSSTTVNKGPLLNLATALFGNNSFIATRSNRLETLLKDGADSRELDDESEEACGNRIPVPPLLPDAHHFATSECTSNYAVSVEMLDKNLVAYVGSFSPYGHETTTDYPSELNNAFGAFVFLANKAWLVSSRQNNEVGARYVYSNPGVAMIIPAISLAGMIVVSLLWAVYIASLLSLAVYSARTPRWTNTLDAFAMLRIGAATRDYGIALKVGFETQAIDALDELPGTIGDATGGESEVGVLVLGALTPLNGVRLYEAYGGDTAKAESQLVVERSPTHVERDGKFYKIRAAEAEPVVVERLPTHVEVDGKVYLIQSTLRGHDGGGDERW